MRLKNLTATTLRNIVGEMELDGTLTSRDYINGKMTAILDEATDKWGMKVNRVELKNIIPPQEIQNAMEKQMKRERDRRETPASGQDTRRRQLHAPRVTSRWQSFRRRVSATQNRTRTG